MIMRTGGVHRGLDSSFDRHFNRSLRHHDCFTSHVLSVEGSLDRSVYYFGAHRPGYGICFFVFSNPSPLIIRRTASPESASLPPSSKISLR